MNPQDIRNMLMDATIKVVSTEGFDKLTTRNVAKACSLHDAYIYRYFIDKDDLLNKTFLREHARILSTIPPKTSLLIDKKIPLKENLRIIIKPIWDYLIANPYSSKFYIRYYYSQHYENDIPESQNEYSYALEEQIKKLTSNNSTLLPQYVLITLIHFAIKSIPGETDMSEKLFEEVLLLLYGGIV